MHREHCYSLTIRWIGNNGKGTAGYNLYDRSHTISAKGKESVSGSSDPAFRGDKTKYSPEDLLVASLSSCHMLWYLHLCAEAEIIVTDYFDDASGTMLETTNGGGRFTEVTLYPVVTVAEKSMINKANELHKKANELCFIANSCNFPVLHKPVCKAAGEPLS